VFLLAIIGVFDPGDNEPGARREHRPARAHEAVARDDDGTHDRVVQQAVPHPVAEDDVNVLGEGDVFDSALNNLNLAVKTVQRDDLTRRRRNRALLDRVDLPSAAASGEHREDARPGANVQDGLVGEECRIPIDRLLVGAGSNLILQHIFVDTEVRIGVEVVVARLPVRHRVALGRHGRPAGQNFVRKFRLHDQPAIENSFIGAGP
jgi:hypothetical protein